MCISKRIISRVFSFVIIFSVLFSLFLPASASASVGSVYSNLKSFCEIAVDFFQDIVWGAIDGSLSSIGFYDKLDTDNTLYCSAADAATNGKYPYHYFEKTLGSDAYCKYCGKTKDNCLSDVEDELVDYVEDDDSLMEETINQIYNLVYIYNNTYSSAYNTYFSFTDNSQTNYYDITIVKDTNLFTLPGFDVDIVADGIYFYYLGTVIGDAFREAGLGDDDWDCYGLHVIDVSDNAFYYLGTEVEWVIVIYCTDGVIIDGLTTEQYESFLEDYWNSAGCIFLKTFKYAVLTSVDTVSDDVISTSTVTSTAYIQADSYSCDFGGSYTISATSDDDGDNRIFPADLVDYENKYVYTYISGGSSSSGGYFTYGYSSYTYSSYSYYVENSLPVFDYDVPNFTVYYKSGSSVVSSKTIDFIRIIYDSGGIYQRWVDTSGDVIWEVYYSYVDADLTLPAYFSPYIGMDGLTSEYLDVDTTQIYSTDFFDRASMIFTVPETGTTIFIDEFYVSSVYSSVVTIRYNLASSYCPYDDGFAVSSDFEADYILVVIGDNRAHIYYSESASSNGAILAYTYSTYTGDTIDSLSDEVENHSHVYTLTDYQAPTCISSGYYLFTCSCGDQYVQTVAATGVHSYNYSIYQAATCIVDGIGLYTCSMCGDQYTVTISSTGSHTYEYSVSQEPTCTADGIAVYTCSVCGDQYSEAIPATGHSYEYSIYKEATCTTAGMGLYTCSVCGDQYMVEIDAYGHDWIISGSTLTTYSLPDDISCPSCSEDSCTCENYTYVLDEDSGAYTITCSDCETTFTVDAEIEYGTTTYTCGYSKVSTNRAGAAARFLLFFSVTLLPFTLLYYTLFYLR